MTTATKWVLRGQELAKNLLDVLNEQTIKELSVAVIEEIKVAYPNANSRKKPLAVVRSALRTAFPESENEKAFYYFTSSGKGNVGRYQHQAFKYLTFSSEEWDAFRDGARFEWNQEQAQQAQGEQDFSSTYQNYQEKPVEIATKTTEKPATATTSVPAKKIKSVPQTKPTPELTLSEMKLEQLELDDDTRQLIENAINQTGMSQASFIQQACLVYAKTVTGKAKKHGEDLTTVPTRLLLEDKSYATHPGRATELTRRTIAAMMRHNNEATQRSQKWCITQSAITSLTGSKAVSVGKTLEQYDKAIYDHHSKHQLLNDKGLPDVYLNRKRGLDITEEIDLVHLVPDGLDINF